MGIIAWIVVGLVAGVLASLVMGGTGYGMLPHRRRCPAQAWQWRRDPSRSQTNPPCPQCP